MTLWNIETARQHVCRFDRLNDVLRQQLVDELNRSFSPALYNAQRAMRRQALQNIAVYKDLLGRSKQKFPTTMAAVESPFSLASMRSCAIMFTAGGEGERLRLSLIERGVPPDQLTDFTKATYPLPGLDNCLSTLAINLKLVAAIGKELNLDIPVIISTGPAGSITAGVIPEIVARNHNFGLKNIVILEQDERLHLSGDEQIVYTINGSTVAIATNPDETGGPLMKLKKPLKGANHSALEWLDTMGKTTLLVLQATAIFKKELIANMAQAALQHDCVGVGIARSSFGDNDPFGSFVMLDTATREQLVILEQTVRNDATRQIRNSGGDYLPYNSGFYALHTRLLTADNLPDYATPPKEIVPDLPRAPKIGYAATDIFPFANNPLVLTIAPSWFGVLKNADDLAVLSAMARQLQLV